MPEQPDAARTETDIRSTGWSDLRRRVYVVLEAGKTEDLASTLFDAFMVTLILANVLAFAAETVPSISERYGVWLAWFDAVSILIFTVEYLARLWVCVEHPPLRHLPAWRVRASWVVRPAMLIDLAVILPFYLSYFIAIDLRVLRVFRLLRFFKLLRFSPALATLGRVLWLERRAIFGALIVMIGLAVCAASVIYALEHEAQPEAFGSVPQAMWWAIATLTTVGYGDVVPITPLGRIFGGLVMIFGLGMFALPIAIISSGFANEIHRREFVVTWGMVARVPLFQSLSASTIADLVQLLEAQVFEPGAVIARRGEEADGMYFIMSGQVLVDVGTRTVTLGEGEYLGELALLDLRRRAATVTAISRVDLLWLGTGEFRRFIRRHPEAHEKITDLVQRRQLNRGFTDEIDREITQQKAHETAAPE